jgi:DNA polymerase III alpha subunit (gram-positive type)
MKVHNLAFIDTETTGTDPNRHEIIELAVIIARQVSREGKGPKLEIIEECEWKIKPEHIERAEEAALRVNGYNEVDWMFAIDRKKAMEEFSKKTQSCTFVSHNLVFDYAFVMKAFDETGVENRMHYAKLDTISMAFARQGTTEGKTSGPTSNRRPRVFPGSRSSEAQRGRRLSPLLSRAERRATHTRKQATRRN